MSGYFARLAAQVRAPAMGAARAAPVAGLEQHVEVEAAAMPSVQQPSSAPLASMPPGAVVAQPVATARSEPVFSPGAPALTLPTMGPAQPMHRDPLSAAQAVESPPMATPWPASMPAPRLDGDLSSPQHVLPADAAVPAPSIAAPAALADSPPSEAVIADAPFDARDDTAPAPTRFIDAQHETLVHPSRAAPAPFVSAVQAPRTVTPVPTAGAFDAHALRDTPVAARTEVRIGTIALQVHTPPPAAAARPAPQPLAAPTPAPPRFSLQRHHLRWS